MGGDSTEVGLDAHKGSIHVAMLLPETTQPVQWQVTNEPTAVRRLARKLLQAAPGEVRCCYEAGPCGYALQRQLEAAGVSCTVVAPSLIPVKPGERIKTDRRDARKLAELFRAGLLTAVAPPTAAEEAVRDLCRAREDAVEDRLRARHRLGKFLLRRGLVWRGGKRMWTQRYRDWVRGLRFEDAADQAVVASYLLAIEQVEERLRTLEAQLEVVAQEEPYRERVGWLRCFRGIDTVTAITLLAELHGFQRFITPRALMAYLGLVPSEHSSGEAQHRGSITKAGNCHARRLLIEAAWHYRHPPAIGKALRQRRQGQPAPVLAVADHAQQRLHRRFARLSARSKMANKVVVAVARELVGFIWAALTPAADVRAPRGSARAA
jgi:transposase